MSDLSKQGKPSVPTPHPDRAGAGGRQDQKPGQTAALLRILQLDADLRRIESERELIYYLANETRAVLGFRQAFILRKRRGWSLEAVSSVTSFDPNAPINRQIKQFTASLSRRPGAQDIMRVRLNDENRLDALQDHMFRHAIWVPLKTRKGTVFAGMLLLHEKEWPESVMPLVERVAEAGAHAWYALKGPSLDRRRWIPRKVLFPVVVGLLLAAGFLKAPLTVLAPAEVSGQEAAAVAVPLEGVLESIEVQPNQPVSAGTLLARIEDTELRNALSIAERRVTVAQARLAQLQNASFVDRAAAREVKVAEAELELAKSERKLAEDRLGRIEVRASASGIAVFDDPKTLTGRPVSVGEKIMEIVSPDRPEFTIRLPVVDNIDLEKGSKVRVFLDGDPLNPIDAILVSTSFRAVTQPDASFAYALKARATNEADLDGARIGAHGTAQLYGDQHSLYFIVFRRPLSWLRQFFGV